MPELSIPKITTCSRCKKLKRRCISKGLDDCVNCEKRDLKCDYFDSNSGSYLPRTYVRKLLETYRSLRQREIQLHMSTEEDTDDSLYPRFLGASSGVSFTKSVLSLAKSINIVKSREITPNLESESDIQTGSVIKMIEEFYPALSLLNDTEQIPQIPSVDKCLILFKKYNDSQKVFQILSEEFFLECVSNSKKNVNSFSSSNLITHMVCSIAYVAFGQITQQSVFFTLALKHYEFSNKVYKALLNEYILDDKMLVSTLLLLQYSLIKPGNPNVWYLLGFAMEICIKKGYYSDKEYKRKTSSNLNQFQKRLFWTTYSFDRVINNTLGRPPSFGDHHIELDFPEVTSDDEVFVNYVLNMRIMQSKCIDLLYNQPLKYSSGAVNELVNSLEYWRTGALNTLVEKRQRDWILYTYYTINVSLGRPSLAVPKPTNEILKICIHNASCLLKVFEDMLKEKTIDCTWISSHWLFVSCLTYIYCILTLSSLNSELTQYEIISDLNRMCTVFAIVAERWETSVGFLEIIQPLAINLIESVLKSFENRKLDFVLDNQPSDFSIRHILDEESNFKYLLDELNLR